MNKILLTSTFLLLGTAMLVGCHPAKKLAKGTTQTDTTIAGTPPSASVANDDLSQRLDVLSGVNASFHTFSGKAKAKLTRGDESNEFTANIRIRHGKAIWMNVSALGGIVNVARVLVTPDSVYFVNFLQRSAKLLPFSEAGKLLPFPVSFADLEALLLGHAPAGTAGSNTMVLVENGFLQRQISNTNGNAQKVFFALPDTAFRHYEIARSSGTQSFATRMAVENPSGERSHLFYKDRVASWQSPAGNGALQMSFENPQWDGEISMPFSVPKNYELN